MAQEDTIKKIRDLLLTGKTAPWKAEDIALEKGIPSPENITVGTLARRAFVEEKSGYRFEHIVIPEQPYHIGYRCPRDGTLWTLAAQDRYTRCGLCDTPLEMIDESERYQRLVNNYIGGVELPNVEVGITSSPEGIISPMAREALKMTGIRSAKEYAAAVAAVTLAGEFNFTTLHIQEKMYTGR